MTWTRPCPADRWRGRAQCLRARPDAQLYRAARRGWRASCGSVAGRADPRTPAASATAGATAAITQTYRCTGQPAGHYVKKYQPSVFKGQSSMNIERMTEFYKLNQTRPPNISLRNVGTINNGFYWAFLTFVCLFHSYLSLLTIVCSDPSLIGSLSCELLEVIPSADQNASPKHSLS